MVSKELQSKHWANKDLKIIQSYWDSPPATKRSLWLVEQLKRYEFDSIFEVGYFSGRNLKYIKEAFPKVKISGLEVNPKAHRFAKEKLGLDDLLCLDAHSINTIDNKYDILFTSGMMIHVPPTDVDNLLSAYIGKTNKYIMHLEQTGLGEIAACPDKNLKPKYKVSDQWQWNNDLTTFYINKGFAVQKIDLPDECRTNGASELVIVSLK